MEDNNENIKNRIEMIIKQFSGKVEESDGEMVPEVAVKGHSGDIHCYSPIKNRFIRIHRGTKAFVLEPRQVNNKVLIYTFDGRILEIEWDELIHTGFD
jgi:hypothetical protein